MGWPQEHLDLLEHLWLVKGLSAGQITARLPYSRSAILGAVHRRGWQRNPVFNAANAARVRRDTSEAAAERREARAHLKRPKPEPPPTYTPSFSIVRANTTQAEPVYARPLAQVCPPAHGCKWPIGDPGEDGFGFCGGASAGKVYCVQHAALAYTPSKPLDKRLANLR